MLSDRAGKDGGVPPAQKEANAVKRGTVIGSVKTTPVNTLFVPLPELNTKLLYVPAFNPVMVNSPVAVEVIVAGPIVVPSVFLKVVTW